MLIRILIAITLILPVAVYTAIKTTAPDFPCRPVSLIEQIEIGGMQQWVMAQGAGSKLPVLLWLHGGPGAAQMPVARHFNHQLEEIFIVVHWDQRGAGKSNPRNFDESTMSVEQYIDDVHQMTQHLKKKFKREKICLLGHSWGTQLGMVAAQRHPEDYHAYIGVGQVVHHHKAHQYAHSELKRRIKERGKKKDLQKLKSLQGPPFLKHSDYVAFAGMMNRYQMNQDVKTSEMVKAALLSEAYNLADLRRWLLGARRGSGPMWHVSQGWDILEWAPGIEIPCYFITGENDFNTPAALVEQMLQQPNAPLLHQHFIIRDAGHTPFLGKPETFASIMQEIIGMQQANHEAYLKKADGCRMSQISNFTLGVRGNFAL